ncbi:MAG TPA: hypothetical protein GX708_09825 [Gallicola sp.]|nr:hypothetical protein [Gallicola sp.]
MISYNETQYKYVIKTFQRMHMKKFAVIDIRASSKILKSIESLGYKIVFSRPYKGVSKTCSSHPDIFLFRLSNNEIIYAPGTDEKLLDELEKYGITLMEGSEPPEKYYPGEIKYNAVIIGKHLFHRVDSTDKTIIREAEKRNLELVNVRQGYTACSVCLVRSNVIITSDTGIHKEAVKRGIESLLIPPQKNIRLEGVKWGFIGGSTGKIDDHKLAVAGNIMNLESYTQIEKFLREKGVEIINLSDEEVMDLGTIMFFTL